MKKTEISKNIKIRIILVTMLILVTSIVGLSYAYFTVNISGNENASSIIITAAELKLIYNDVQIISGEYETPGWTETKTLTVQNVGTDDVSYTIIWRDLINELANGELVISATCVATSGTCPNIPETVVPTSLTEIHNVKVKEGISIAVGVTHTYTLTALFKDTGSNQNYNQNKYFNGTLNIKEYEPPFKSEGVDSTTGLKKVSIQLSDSKEEFYVLSETLNYPSLVSTNGNIYNYESGKSILLARYNLYVGRIYTSSYSVISSSASGYGLQSADARGYVDSSTPRIGVLPFAGSSGANGYWYTGSALKSQYGSSYEKSNVYDANYRTAPNYSYAFNNNANNANYSIAYYVEEYVSRLGVEATGRLLTYTEASALTTTQRTSNQRYWIGSANSGTNVRFVGLAGNITNDGFQNSTGNGCRPVIVVNTSDIQSN